MTHDTSNHNPYRSPVAAPAPPANSYQTARRKALWQVRLALVVLMVPAVANYLCFHFVRAPQRFNGPVELHSPIMVIASGFNALLLGMLCVVVWFLALWLLERIATILKLLVRDASSDDWLRVLHNAINRRLLFAAMAGACVWLGWIGMFYYTDVHIIIIHNLAAALAWAAVAWIVLPLLLSWWRFDTTKAAA